TATYSHTQEAQKFEIPTISLWYVLLIGVFLFTSGLFLGMKISQKESSFASSEVQSFRNISETEANSERTRADIIEPEPTNERENSIISSVPKNLQFPPKLNQVNYIIQLGNFSIEDANKYAASLIHERQEFQGRVFRTSTGKLYLGFYYDLKEAKSVLKKIKKFQGGIFQDAEIKNIQF
ncbi:MAG: SPOR domain-containing protein, partial [Leptospiraceae bacterium]|nr:SPOR domain-containing protein [Leptospiraceae bacterium]